MAKTICLSPSDHGVNSNKCLLAGCYEDKHTKPIADETARHLKYNGFNAVIMTSHDIYERCRQANKMGADLYVPIHTNASGTASARYLMFMFWQDNAAHRALFNAVAPKLEAVYPGNLKSKFAVRQELIEINSVEAMALYCELGFHTNRTDVDNFIHNPKMVGKALAQGICAYYGVAFKDADAVEEKEEEKKPEEKKVDGLYLVRVSSEIDIYKAPVEKNGKCPKGAYTIVEEQNGFGKLKSSTEKNPKWIELAKVKKI